MTDPCPDAEKAALAWELEQWLGAPSEIHDGVIWKDSSGLVVSTDMLLANLSPAAKEIARKAQAHDAMKAENERLRRLERLLLTDHQLGVVVDEWPMPAEREAAAQELARRAALKEPE